MHRKLLFFIPIPAQNLTRGWHRDQGLLVDEARKQGYEAFLVCPPPAPQITDERMIVATYEDLSRGKWWVSQKPWAVVCNTWGAPRHSNIRAAALNATPRVLDRLDSDGNKSPSVELPLFVYTMWSRIHDLECGPFRKLMAPFTPWAHVLAQRFAPSLVDRTMAQAVANTPMVTLESPIAVARMIRLLQQYNMRCNHVRLLPHPVVDTSSNYTNLRHKKNIVMSAGRWNAHSKNFGLQIAALDMFLKNQPDWSAALAGVLPEHVNHFLKRCHLKVQPRLTMLGHLEHDKLTQLMVESRIFFISSRHESFNISAAEALCRGCSVVGPPHLASVQWFTGSDSGTSATLYSRHSLADALASEAILWGKEESAASSPKRNPEGIAKIWRDRVGAAAVFSRMLQLLDSISSSR